MRARIAVDARDAVLEGATCEELLRHLDDDEAPWAIVAREAFVVCARSGTSRWRRSKRSISTPRSRLWPRDSTDRVSAKPGAIHMRFRRIPGEYRMASDDKRNELSLLFTDPEAVWHFRLVTPDWQLDFEAVQVLDSVLEWQVERIFETRTPTSAEPADESARASSSADLSLLVQALLDFGHFFGERAGEVKVSLKTDTNYRNQ